MFLIVKFILLRVYLLTCNVDYRSMSANHVHTACHRAVRMKVGKRLCNMFRLVQELQGLIEARSCHHQSMSTARPPW